LNSLFKEISCALKRSGVIYSKAPIYQAFREGDVRHSQANIEKISKILGYSPLFDVKHGVAKAIPWYIEFFKMA
ncbi:MAG: LPS biosynthesis protein WbpP, partial [Gammaproteobacteria bacterium]